MTGTPSKMINSKSAAASLQQIPAHEDASDPAALPRPEMLEPPQTGDLLGYELQSAEVENLLDAAVVWAPDLATVKEGAAQKSTEEIYYGLLDRTRERVVAKAMEFLDGVFRKDDIIELRALDPRRSRRAELVFVQLGLDVDRKRLQKFIATHHGWRSLYVGINPRTGRSGGRSKDVAVRRHVVLDLDNKEAPDWDPDWSGTLAALKELDPFAVVASGGGWHVWLAIEEVEGTTEVAASATPLGAAMAAIHSDNMADPPRIIRLPGTINVPDDRKRGKGRVLSWSTVDQQPKANSVIRAVDDLSNQIGSLARDLGFPGRTPSAGSRVRGLPTASGSEAPPRPAPSAEMLRLALEQLPNHPLGPFDDFNDWQKLGYAVKGAAVAAGIASEGLAIWLDWCAQHGGDPSDHEKFWEDWHKPRSGWTAVLETLQNVNPAGHQIVEEAVRRQGIARFSAPLDPAQQHLLQSAPAPKSPKAINLTPVQAPAPQSIPPRRWYYGRSVMGGFVSMIVAPGGTGKSALVMGEAVAMATGQNLLGEAPVRPLKVWLHSAEDDNTEALRRLSATLIEYGLKWPDLNGNICLTSGRDHNLMLAVQSRDGGQIVRDAVDSIAAEVLAASVDVIIFDPLAAMHTVNENANEAANLLMGALREIAHRTGAAVVLVHHASKAAAMDMDQAGVAASRGASAFTDAARVVRQLARMTVSEADKFGIPRDLRWRYFRVENGKSNMAPASDARWFELASVALHNGSGLWPHGDEVGVVRRWTPPGPVSGTKGELMQVQQAISTAMPDQTRESDKSPHWVGYLIAAELGWDIGTPRSKAHHRNGDQQAARVRVKSLLENWVADGSLRSVEWHDTGAGKSFKVIEVGEVPLPFDEGKNAAVA